MSSTWTTPSLCSLSLRRRRRSHLLAGNSLYCLVTEAHVCVNNLAEVALDSMEAEIWSSDLLIASPACRHINQHSRATWPGIPRALMRVTLYDQQSNIHTTYVTGTPRRYQCGLHKRGHTCLSLVFGLVVERWLCGPIMKRPHAYRNKQMNIHRVSEKKSATFIFAITSAKADQFSKIFHC